MQLRVMTEPQEGATYEDLLAVAQESERLGYDAFFRSDHLLHIGDHPPGAGSTETWATLAGLARETSRIRLGTMVSSATFRLPGLLALTVATVDAMSGGRVEVGLGGGWYEREHRAFGIPLPALGDRFDRLEEQLAILTGLWSTPPGQAYSYHGRHYTLEDHPAVPRPAQQRPPVIIGGNGLRRTPRLAARFADEFNVPPSSSLEDTAAGFARVRAACEQAGRDPASLVLSVCQALAVGEDPDQARRRAAAAGVDPKGEDGIFGTVEQALERIGGLGDLGARRVYLQVLDLHDLDHLRLVAAEVAPRC